MEKFVSLILSGYIQYKVKDTKIRLHIGAFDYVMPGWINTDITPHIFVSKIPFVPLIMYKLGLISKERYIEHKKGVFKNLYYMDLTKQLPLKDNSVEAVFSSHVFEHLFIDEVELLIHEIKRVLIPGGICRIVVPDLEKIVACWNVNDPREFLQNIFDIAKRSAVKNQHHSGFTGSFLTRLFMDAGFAECQICSYKVGRCPNIDKLDNRPDSLFFEAIK